MPLTSDISLNVQKFDPSAVSDGSHATNNALTKMQESGPTWWEVGAEKYREMRVKGETPFPKAVIIESGTSSSIPSREEGRSISTRIFKPEQGDPVGIFMHIHGGGWVLQSEATQDPYLKFLSDKAQLLVISVGYRLAPEHAHPAAPGDCYDAAEWLVDNARKEYGLPLLFVGGESAGGHLSSLVALHLLNTRPSFSFKGLLLHFGIYNLASFHPAVYNFHKTLILSLDIVNHFIDAYLPETTVEYRRDPSVSPFYADFRAVAKQSKHGLPSVLFTCGTEDPLLDDTLTMGAKWMVAGGEAIVKFYPGAPHAFTGFSPEKFPGAGDWFADMEMWLREKAGLSS